MIRVVVDSRVRVLGLPESAAARLKPQFEHKNPERLDDPSAPATIDTWREDGGWLTFPRGGADRVRGEIGPLLAAWEDRRVAGEPHGESYRLSKPLYPFQEEMVRVAMERETALLIASTGSGKTQAGIALAAALGVPTIVIVHTDALRVQWIDRACELLSRPRRHFGVFGDGRRELRPITVATHQTLSRPGAITDEVRAYFGCVIFDECQRAPAATAFAAVDPFPAKYRVFLSASEKRRDGRHAITYDLVGPVAHEVTKAEMVEEGRILDVEVRVVPTDFSADWYLRGTSRPARWPGERNLLHTRLVDAMCADPARNALLHEVADAELRAGEQVIVLSRRVEHCRVVDREFVARGVRAGFLVGGKENKPEFEATKRGLADGSVRAGVGTIDALGTGIDLPTVAAGILACPTASNEQLTGQVSGRLCRTAEGKGGARLYYLWDWRVMRGHLANLARWFPTVRVLTARGWVGAKGAEVEDLDLDPGGITERLRDRESKEATRMKSRKPGGDPAASQQSAPAAAPTPSAPERTVGLFEKTLDSPGLAADPSALHIALKAKGFAGGASVVRDWAEPHKLSAAMWVLGKLEEVPAHVQAGLGPPPKSSRSPIEEDLLAMANRMKALGVDVDVDLKVLAGYEPSRRAQIARWLEGADKPDFLIEAEKTDPRSPGVEARDVFNPLSGTFEQATTAASGASYEGPEFMVPWGEERYCLAPGASIVSCTVGPFELRARVGPNETAGQALARANAELTKFAEEERARKLASHRRVLLECGILKEGAK